jgi:hypothetical protein
VGRVPHRNTGIGTTLSCSITGSSQQHHTRHKALNATSSTIMSIDGTGVSEYVVGDGPLSSAAGPSTDPLDNMTHCPLQPMGVVVGASADAADAEKKRAAA